MGKELQWQATNARDEYLTKLNSLSSNYELISNPSLTSKNYLEELSRRMRPNLSYTLASSLQYFANIITNYVLFLYTLLTIYNY